MPKNSCLLKKGDKCQDMKTKVLMLYMSNAQFLFFSCFRLSWILQGVASVQVLLLKLSCSVLGQLKLTIGSLSVQKAPGMSSLNGFTGPSTYSLQGDLRFLHFCSLAKKKWNVWNSLIDRWIFYTCMLIYFNIIFYWEFSPPFDWQLMFVYFSWINRLFLFGL